MANARRLAGAALLLTLVAHAVYASLGTVTGADMWWHLASGRYIVEHRAVPGTDVFSFTAAGRPWHNHEWLSQVVFFAVYRLFGGTGLALLEVVLGSALIVLATWIAWRRGGDATAAVAAGVAASFVCRPYLDVRPQLFSFL